MLWFSINNTLFVVPVINQIRKSMMNHAIFPHRCSWTVLMLYRSLSCCCPCVCPPANTPCSMWCSLGISTRHPSYNTAHSWTGTTTRASRCPHITGWWVGQLGWRAPFSKVFTRCNSSLLVSCSPIELGWRGAVGIEPVNVACNFASLCFSFNS